jgi:hypothetical protein
MPRAIDIHEELTGIIDDLRIIDSHEHLPDEKDRPGEKDVLAKWLTHYFSCDLVSAGLSDDGLRRVRDASADLMTWRGVLVRPGRARSGQRSDAGKPGAAT